MSQVRGHMSCVRCQVSGVNIKCQIFIFFWQSGGIRFCYQQGLPHLVYLLNQPSVPNQFNISYVKLSLCLCVCLFVPQKKSHFRMLKKVLVKDWIPNFTVPASACQLFLYRLAQLTGLGMTQFSKKGSFFRKNEYKNIDPFTPTCVIPKHLLLGVVETSGQRKYF